MTTLADAAVLHARVGHAVFPVGEDKAPLTARGHHDATTDVEAIRAWSWDGGIGMAVPERTIVVDVDPRNGGAETMRALVQAYGELPRTRTVMTRSGGRHYYFRLPDDRDTRGRLGSGVDVKKPGRGYVLVPPSPGYSYLVGGLAANAPQWLLDEIAVGARGAGEHAAPKFFKGLVVGTAYGIAALRQKLQQVREHEEGGRRANLNLCAFVLGQLVAGGELDEEKTLEELLTAALDSGLSEQQALSAMRSGWSAGMQNPRQADDGC